MRRTLSWLIILGSCCPLAAAPVPAPVAPVADESVELQSLLNRLSALSDQILHNAQSPQSWSYYLEQGEVMLRLATHTKGEERDRWLRMAIDSHYAAAVQSPANELTASQRLAQLPMKVAHDFPGHALYTYAALQEVQADYMRLLSGNTSTPTKAKEYLSQRLVRFAQEYPEASETPKAIWDAGQHYESLGKTTEACQCYRYLGERYPGNALARKAGGALWRQGSGGEPVHLELPLLYAAENRLDQTFDLAQLRGKLVFVYFWSSATGQVTNDLQGLKQLGDHYLSSGLEIVYVNLDSDPATARAFLSGQFTVGTHLHAKGGLDGEVAEKYGIQTLPQAFLISKEGTLIKDTLQPSQLVPEVMQRLDQAH